MNISSLVEELRTDNAAWETAQAAHQEVIDRRRERQRLERMTEQARVAETDALTRLAAALTVIKHRQEGKS